MKKKKLQSFLSAQVQQRHDSERQHSAVNMAVPDVPAILAYLRWLDRMESWNGRNFPSNLHQVARRNAEADLYSWGTDFRNPIQLPQIKKYARAEKYRSEQLKNTILTEKTIKNRTAVSETDSSPLKEVKTSSSSTQRPFADYYRPNVWLPQPKAAPKVKSKSAPAFVKVRSNGKPTPFSVHAKQGFKYWPDELRKKKEHPTRYSFGDRYNPGRAGVITDRIYSKPRTNYHYWAEFEQHQKPIGSGNFVLKTKN